MLALTPALGALRSDGFSPDLISNIDQNQIDCQIKVFEFPPYGEVLLRSFEKPAPPSKSVLGEVRVEAASHHGHEFRHQARSF